MEWVNFFFSFKGRFNRARFWLANGLLVLVTIAIVVPVILATAPLTYEAIENILYNPFIVVASILIFISTLAVGVKRLHDRDKAGHWILLFYIAPNVLSGIAESFRGSDAELSPTFLALSILSFGMSIWGLIELGVLKGEDGPNQYGDDPLNPGSEVGNAFDR